MPYLTILRHAKSSWDYAGLDDHSRPLNSRGQRDAPRVGHAIQNACEQHGIPTPSLALVSTATRAQETAELVLPAITAGIRVDSQRDLYLASTRTMMNAIAQADENAHHVMTVAHNPGSHELACTIAKSGGIDTFPTCCAVILALDIEAWGLLDEDQGDILEQIRPRFL